MNKPGTFLRFQLERWIQRGVFHQLLFVAALIIAISVLGGLTAWLATDQFSNPLEAVWWSFLRLTDPGYLGDDQGAALRVVATIVTVLGYVVFMGSLIAIMTQWLNETVTRFESGLAPISMHGHVVILGWTNRTPENLRQLLSAKGRLRRFLNAHENRRLRIVVVAEEVSAERRYRLRTFLGDRWRGGQTFLRAGSSLKPADLERFDLRRAAAIIVPGDEFSYENTDASDAHVVKTLLNLRPILESLSTASQPVLVAEVFDPRRERAARRVTAGKLEVVAGDAVIARLMAQTIRDRRLSGVFLELLSHRRGCTPYIRAAPQFVDCHPIGLNPLFDNAIVIGAVRTKDGYSVTHLNPPHDFRLKRDDLLVLVARSYEDCEVKPGAGDELPPGQTSIPVPDESGWKRVLILGWSYKVGSILEELVGADAAGFEVTLVSRRSQAERAELLQGFSWNAERLRIEHVEVDHMVSGVLEGLDLVSFDSILLLASTSNSTAEESDARTILGYEILKSVLEAQTSNGEKEPDIITEIVHPASSLLFSDPQDVVLVTPKILGFLQAHVALRSELNSVFSELFATGGTELVIRPPEYYGLAGKTITYHGVQQRVVSYGEVALGVMMDSGTTEYKIELCPSPDRQWSSESNSSIVALAAVRSDPMR